MPDNLAIDFIARTRVIASQVAAAYDALNDIKREELAMAYADSEANEIDETDITDYTAANTNVPPITLAQWQALWTATNSMLTAWNTVTAATPLHDAKFYQGRV